MPRSFHTLVRLLLLAPPALAGDATWPTMRNDAANTGFASTVKAMPGTTAGADFLWNYTTGRGIFSTPIVSSPEEDLMMVGSADHFFYALSATTGKERWKLQTGEIIDSAGAIAGPNVLVPSADGHIYAVDRSTGKPVWTFAAHHAAGSPDQHAGKHCTFIPPQGGTSNWFEGNVKVDEDGSIFAGSDDFRMYSLSPNGTERWAFWAGPLPDGALWGIAAVDAANDQIIATAMNTQVYAIGRKDGECRWETTLDMPISSSAAVAGGLVFIGSWDSKLYALHAKTGSVAWKFLTRDHIYSSPAVDTVRSRVYVASVDGTLYALSLEGKLLWMFDTLAPIRASVSVSSDGIVFFGAADSVLYAVGPDGKRVFSFDGSRGIPAKKGKGMNSSPALGTKAVYIGAYDGNIWGVGYDYCAKNHASDSRCSIKTEGDLPTVDGSYLYWFTPSTDTFGPGGASGKPFLVPPRVPRGALITVQLLARSAGLTIDAQVTSASTIIAELTDPEGKSTALTAHLSGSPNRYVTFRGPQDFVMMPDKTYVLTTQIHWKDSQGTASGTASGSFAFKTEAAATVPAAMELPTHLEARHVSPFIPPIVTSLNQIGFDSLNMVGVKLGEGVGLMIGAIAVGNGTELKVDPNNTAMSTFSVVEDGGGGVVLTATYLNLVTGGPIIKVEEFRLGGQQIEDGSFGGGTSMLARASCLDNGVAGFGLLLFGICNAQQEFFAIGTIQVSPRVGGDPGLPKGSKVNVTSLKLTSGVLHYHVDVAFSVTAMPANAHAVNIVLVDEGAAPRAPVSMDMKKAMSVTAAADGSLQAARLTVPTNGLPHPERTTAYVVIDTTVVASQPLQKPMEVLV